jgi:hypothetical protein
VPSPTRPRQPRHRQGPLSKRHILPPTTRHLLHCRFRRNFPLLGQGRQAPPQGLPRGRRQHCRNRLQQGRQHFRLRRQLRLEQGFRWQHTKLPYQDQASPHSRGRVQAEAGKQEEVIPNTLGIILFLLRVRFSPTMMSESSTAAIAGPSSSALWSAPVGST